MEWTNLGKILLVVGGILVLTGIIVILVGKPGFIGRLPGDFFVQKGNFRFYFPLMSFLILSAVLTIVINILLRILR